jgi:hypothetical protein
MASVYGKSNVPLIDKSCLPRPVAPFPSSRSSPSQDFAIFPPSPSAVWEGQQPRRELICIRLCTGWVLIACPGLRVHTEWQRPLSGKHSIMMEKLAQAGEGEGCTPTPFHNIYHPVQSGTLQWADTFTLFYFYLLRPFTTFL